MSESPDYRERKSRYDRMLTVYGRKPALETLRDPTLRCHTLHLADSNREAGIIAEIRQQALQRDIPIKTHSRAALSRISKNGKQDQGVAVDVECPGFVQLEEYLSRGERRRHRLLALDGITNPQNLGMIIRTATAGDIDGIILPRKGTAALGPLVIKSSAGTVYGAPLLLCDELVPALQLCRTQGAQVCTLDAKSSHSLFQHSGSEFCIYVLGNETDGVSHEVTDLADKTLSIPMRNGVESLNVAVTASLVAFGTYLDR